MNKSDSKIRILYLIYQLGYGGAQRLILDLIRNLDRSLYEPVVAMWGGRREIVDDFQKIGVEVVDFGGRGKLDLRALWRLYRYLSEEPVDIFNTHLPHAHVVGRIAGKLAGVPWIVATHQNVYSANHPVTRVVDVRTTWMDDFVTAITQGVEESFFADSKVFSPELLWEGRTHFTIYSGVDVEKIDRAIADLDPERKRKELGLKNEEYVFACAARLHPNKAHRYLIDAVARLQSAYSDFQVLLLGDGPLEEELKGRVRRLNLGHSIRFLGYRDDVYEIFAASDAFVLPSINEGFGIAVAEAMAAGLPVIATEIPAVVEVVEDRETGLLAPARDAGELAKAMSTYIEIPKLGLMHGRQGRKRVEAMFSIQEVAKNYEMLYSKMYNK